MLGLGSNPTDSAEDRRCKRLFVGFAPAVIVLAPPCAGIYYAYGESEATSSVIA